MKRQENAIVCIVKKRLDEQTLTPSVLGEKRVGGMTSHSMGTKSKE